MCLAIYKPKGVQVAKKYLRNGFDSNEDGAGFAIARNGAIEIYKGYFRFGDFWKAFKPFQAEAAIIHFRWATHGKTNEDNCHPFSVCDGKFAIIHNGILNIDCTENKERSDTWHFAEMVLTPVLKALTLTDPALKYLVETSIGDGNKIVVLAADARCVIFNEAAGEWHHGAWFSNNGYKYSAHWSMSIMDAARGAFRYPPMGKNSSAKVTDKREAFPDYEGDDAAVAAYAYGEEEESDELDPDTILEAQDELDRQSVQDYLRKHRDHKDGIVETQEGYAG